MLIAHTAAAQTAPPIASRCPGVDVQSQETGAAVEHRFTLDVDECRLIERELTAGLVLDLGREARQQGVEVVVGVGVAMRVLEVTLRGVIGSGRFRGSLQRLRDVIDRHAAARRAAADLPSTEYRASLRRIP